MKKAFFLLIPILYLTSSYAQNADSKTINDFSLPAGYTSSLDVVYSKLNGWEGKMDIFLPPGKAKPAPMVIFIHGGGWNHGTKESERAGFNTFFSLGFAVASISYRLVDIAPAPAAIIDTRCALSYIADHAKDLNINVDKIIVIGGSAGGHLALMAGLLGNDHRFDINCKSRSNVKVAAIIDKYGVTDLGNIPTNKSVRAWLGDNINDSNFIKSVSPVSYVNPSSPPVLIIHGDMDHTVPYEQSTYLYDLLKKAGVVTEFVTIKGAAHGKFSQEQTAQANNAILAFLKKCGLLAK